MWLNKVYVHVQRASVFQHSIAIDYGYTNCINLNITHIMVIPGMYDQKHCSLSHMHYINSYMAAISNKFKHTTNPQDTVGWLFSRV